MQILNRALYDGLWQSRAAAAFAVLERGFLEAYGRVGRHFYAGLGRKTERLKAADSTADSFFGAWALIDL